MSTEKPPLNPHPLSEYVAWAGNRNREPILGVLKEKFPKDSAQVLEMELKEQINMPANNFSLIFGKI